VAWGHVQTVSAIASPAATTIAIAPITVATGDTVFVSVSWGTGTGGGNATVADNLSNSYTQIGATVNDTVDNQSIAWFYGRIAAGGSCTITSTFVSSTNRGTLVSQYRGLDAGSPLVDFKQTTNGTCSTATDNATTPTTAQPTGVGQLVVGSATITDATGVLFAPGTGFAERGESNDVAGGANLEHEDRSTTSTSTLGATWTAASASTHLQCLVAIFKEASVVTPSFQAIPFMR
jgi:hypothetical protein